MRYEAEHVAISKSKGIAIDWRDGLRAELSNALLRDECPCATCTGAHGTPPKRSNYQNPAPASPFPIYKPRLAMTHVEPVGNYALRIYWNDGHSSGIYTWELLRELSEKMAQKESPS
ncbi:MAG: DUF971 domain-containing protein [Nitrospira sp.]|nr:DUF971 domain-containing protein [Nitrospira sp.]